MMSDLENHTAETHRLRAERDRLFGLVVAAQQIDQAGRGLTRAQAIEQVVGWMTRLDPPNLCGEIARALAEHDQRSP